MVVELKTNGPTISLHKEGQPYTTSDIASVGPPSFLSITCHDCCLVTVNTFEATNMRDITVNQSSELSSAYSEITIALGPTSPDPYLNPLKISNGPFIRCCISHGQHTKCSAGAGWQALCRRGKVGASCK